MTPKEKAKELFVNFWNYDISVKIDIDYSDNLAKKYALKCVDEIIKECGNWIGGGVNAWDKERFEYWKEVKQEIKKL